MLRRDNLHEIAVKINNLGSGLLITLGKKSFVITAYHCLFENEENSLTSEDGTITYKIQKIYSDKTKDIALIEVDFVASNFLVKGTTDISLKNKITAYGFPNKFKLTTGLAFDGEVNATHNGLTIKMDDSYVGSNTDDIPAIENIQGWSGSGIFKVADDGELFLIGISSRLPDESNTFKIMKCVSIKEILEFIESEKLGSLEVVENCNKEKLFKKMETIMTEAELKGLIAQKENAKLDFKREWYKEKDLKTELIKDVIALTNGNIHTIGQPSYLVIGVKEGSNGNELHHVELDKSVDEIKKQLLQNLQNYATPSIHDLEIEEFVVDSKNIVVVEIPFHPYLVILKEKLRQFHKDTLLYRAGEGTVSADYATRKAFEEALEEYNNTEPIYKNLKDTTETVINDDKLKKNLKEIFNYEVEEFKKAIFAYYPTHGSNFEKFKKADSFDKLIEILLYREEIYLHCLLREWDKSYDVNKHKIVNCKKLKENADNSKEISGIILKVDSIHNSKQYNIGGYLRFSSEIFEPLNLYENVDFDALTTIIKESLRGKLRARNIELQLILPNELFNIALQCEDNQIKIVKRLSLRIDNYNQLDIDAIRYWKRNSQFYTEHRTDMFERSFIYILDDNAYIDEFKELDNDKHICLLSNNCLHSSIKEIYDYGVPFAFYSSSQEMNSVNSIDFSDMEVQNIKDAIFRFMRRNRRTHFIYDDYNDLDFLKLESEVEGTEDDYL